MCFRTYSHTCINICNPCLLITAQQITVHDSYYATSCGANLSHGAWLSLCTHTQNNQIAPHTAPRAGSTRYRVAKDSSGSKDQ